MDRAQKADSIETLKGVFAGSGAVVVTHYLGLTVAEMTDLRGRLRKEGASLKVVKNRLAQKALNGAGDGATALFKGPVAIAYGPDAVSAAKVSRISSGLVVHSFMSWRGAWAAITVTAEAARSTPRISESDCQSLSSSSSAMQ